MSYQAGLKALEEGKYQEAIDFFYAFLDQSSAQLKEAELININLLLGQCYLMTGNYPSAYDCFQCFLKATEFTDNNSLFADRPLTRSLAFAFMGLCCEGMGQEVQAVNCYLESIKLNSRNLLAVKQLSLYYLKITQFQKDSEISSSGFAPPYIGRGFDLLRNVAETSCSLSEIRDLLEIFNAWHEEARPLMSPSLQFSCPVIFYRAISNCYRSLCSSYLSPVLKEQTQSDWSKFAKFCALFLYDFDNVICYQYALDFSKELLDLSPNDAEAWDIQGRIYLKLGANSEANNSFNQALLLEANRQIPSVSPRIRFGMFSEEELPTTTTPRSAVLSMPG